MSKPVCAKCGSERTSRREREGFFQKTIMSSFGFFPWECTSCWKRFYSTERGQRVRRRSKDRSSLEPSGH